MVGNLCVVLWYVSEVVLWGILRELQILLHGGGFKGGLMVAIMVTECPLHGHLQPLVPMCCSSSN